MVKNTTKYMSFSTDVNYLNSDGGNYTKKKIVVIYYESNDPAFINIAIGAPFDSEPTIEMHPFREDFEKVFKGHGNYLPDDTEEGDELDVIVSKDDKGNMWFSYKGKRGKEINLSISSRQSKKLMKLMAKVYPFDDYADKEPEDFE